MTHLTTTLSRRLLHLLLFVGFLALISCTPLPAHPPNGGRAPMHTKRPERKTATLPPAPPPFTVIAKRGALSVKSEHLGAPRRLAVGERARGIVALRSEGASSLVSLLGADGGEVGKLWLRADSELAWGLAERGELRLRLVRGEARLSLYAANVETSVVSGKRRLVLRDRDVLLLHDGRGTQVTPTASAPGAAAWTLALLETPQAAGVGSLEVRRRGSDGASSRSRLALRSLSVRAKTLGAGAFVAETRVEHIFHNGSDERLEGTFRFPLPAGASLLSLAMEIDGKLMEGELVERQKARRTYEAIVDSMRDPALLEWEQGNIFKLRVFPIEPKQDKRVVLRYLAPIASDPRAPTRRVFRYHTEAPGLQKVIPRFRLVVDGKVVVDKKGFACGRELAVKLPDATSQVLREARKDGVYTALRVVPDWRALRRGQGSASSPLQRSSVARDLLIVVDTSRSALEARPLALKAVETLLAGLTPRDRFALVASDLSARDAAPDFLAPAAEARRGALAFLRGIEPDGATDLAAALNHAGKRLRGRTDSSRRPQLVYIGDGTPTWGITGAQALSRVVAGALDETPLTAVVLGKGADSELLCALAGQQGGRCVAAKTRRELRQLSLALARPQALRLAQVTLRAGEHDEVFPRQAPTLFFGEALTVLVRSPEGKPAPTQLTLTARFAGQPVVLSLPARAVSPSKHVAHLWARAKLAQLKRDGADKKTIVATSLRYGVMSKHTAFLVLESEEAYKRWGIARRKARREAQRLAAAPKVSGADLESVAGRQARLSPDHLQPGDPEVRIPAPADAKSVVVVFPFGETKVARYEPELSAWTVRFLVAQDTPDGTYQVTVRITHADDRVQILRLSYVVDSQAPLVKLQVIKRRRGYTLQAKQVVRQRELLVEKQREAIRSGGAASISSAGSKLRFAEVAQDVKRVEVRLPSGKVITLYHHKLGSFVGRWRPSAQTLAAGPVMLTVVASDRAQNRRVERFRFDPQSGALSSLGVTK